MVNGKIGLRRAPVCRRPQHLDQPQLGPTVQALAPLAQIRALAKEVVQEELKLTGRP